MNFNTLNAIKSAAHHLVGSKPVLTKSSYPSLEETINSILSASSPAHKAIATRRLWAYAIGHSAAIGSTPKRVIAGVCAAATKRMNSSNKNKSPNVSTIEDLTNQVMALKKKLEILVKATS
jgi:hypothetical protein